MVLAAVGIVLLGVVLLLPAIYLSLRSRPRHSRAFMAGGGIVSLIGLALLVNTSRLPGPSGQRGPMGLTAPKTATSSGRPTLTPIVSPTEGSRHAPTATLRPGRIVCADALPSQLRLGYTAYVSYEPGLANRLRTEPDIDDSDILARISPGTVVVIHEGPRCADGMAWWRVQVLAGTLRGWTGWTAEGDASAHWLIPLEHYLAGRQPGRGVVDFSPKDLILLPEEIPAPSTFGSFSLAPSPNSEVLEERGADGLSYLLDTGRIDGVKAEFLAESGNATAITDLAIELAVFESSIGPAFVVSEEGGPCAEDEAYFYLVDGDLGLGDFSVLCMSSPIQAIVLDHQGGQVWVRVGYRNVYFDVLGYVAAPIIDGAHVINIAAAQLDKLESFQLSESMVVETATSP